MINKDFCLFHVAENLCPDIDLEEINFILTWFLSLYFSCFVVGFLLILHKETKPHAKFCNISKPNLASTDQVT